MIDFLLNLIFCWQDWTTEYKSTEINVTLPHPEDIIASYGEGWNENDYHPEDEAWIDRNAWKGGDY